jgi:hypothetical protein
LECFIFILSSITATIAIKIKIGQVVSCNSYRNPALFAKIIHPQDFVKTENRTFVNDIDYDEMKVKIFPN